MGEWERERERLLLCLVVSDDFIWSEGDKVNFGTTLFEREGAVLSILVRHPPPLPHLSQQ